MISYVVSVFPPSLSQTPWKAFNHKGANLLICKKWKMTEEYPPKRKN